MIGSGICIADCVCVFLQFSIYAKKIEALIVKNLNLSEILMIDLEQQAYSKLEEAGEDSRGIWEPTLLRGFQSGKLKSYCCNLKSLNTPISRLLFTKEELLEEL